MNKVKIITDSCCSFSREELEKFDIDDHIANEIEDFDINDTSKDEKLDINDTINEEEFNKEVEKLATDGKNNIDNAIMKSSNDTRSKQIFDEAVAREQENQDYLKSLARTTASLACPGIGVAAAAIVITVISKSESEKDNQNKAKELK